MTELTVVDGWVREFTTYPGPKDKVYSKKNTGQYIINHSIVGSVQAALSRFTSTQRDSSGNYTPYAAASVMFINPYVGVPIQMYPITASTWTSGGPEANTSMWAVENEGGGVGNYSEPLNPNQVANLFLIKQLWEQVTKKVATRATFREHNEVAAEYGYSPTACPSNRIQPFYDALEQEQDMTPEEVKAIVDQAIADALYNSKLIDSGQVPELVAQIIGSRNSSYTSAEDKAVINEVRTKLFPPQSVRTDEPIVSKPKVTNG